MNYKEGTDYNSKLYKTIENIDKVNPTISFTEQTEGNVAVTYQDEKSGIASAKYAITTSTETPAVDAFIAMPASGSVIAVADEQYVHYIVADKAGNITQGIFTLNTVGTLSAVEITSPANGSTIDTTDVQLKWNHVDGATYYVIHIRDITLGEEKSQSDEYLLTPIGGRRIDPAAIQNEYSVNLSDILETGKQFEVGKVYNIAVNACAPRYQASWGVTKVAIALPQLPTPTILTPSSDNSVFKINGSAIFSWQKSENATMYKIYVKDVTDLPESEWNGSNVPTSTTVYKDNCFIVDGVNNTSVDLMQTGGNYIAGHTYKVCVIASEGGVNYQDSEGNIRYFALKPSSGDLNQFRITIKPSEMSAYTKSTVDVSWTAPVQSIGAFKLTGYKVSLIKSIGSSYYPI